MSSSSWLWKVFRRITRWPPLRPLQRRRHTHRATGTPLCRTQLSIIAPVSRVDGGDLAGVVQEPFNSLPKRSGVPKHGHELLCTSGASSFPGRPTPSKVVTPFESGKGHRPAKAVLKAGKPAGSRAEEKVGSSFYLRAKLTLSSPSIRRANKGRTARHRWPPGRRPARQGRPRL